MSFARLAGMAVDPETMEELLADVVASVGGDEVLVDLGGRPAGVLSLHEANGEGMNVAIGSSSSPRSFNPRDRADGRSCRSPMRAVDSSGRGRATFRRAVRISTPRS